MALFTIPDTVLQFYNSPNDSSLGGLAFELAGGSLFEALRALSWRAGSSDLRYNLAASLGFRLGHLQIHDLTVCLVAYGAPSGLTARKDPQRIKVRG